MSHPNHLSIDIARDAQCRAEHMDPVCDAVESLSRQIGHIGLGRIGRVYNFSTPIAEMDLARIGWTFHTADLHVIVTEQRLSNIGSNVIRGLTWLRKSDHTIGERHALISHSSHALTRLTTGHEIGHLLGCSHCGDPSCQMHQQITHELINKFAQSKSGESYCDNCLEQAEVNASQLYRQRMIASTTAKV